MSKENRTEFELQDILYSIKMLKAMCYILDWK